MDRGIKICIAAVLCVLTPTAVFAEGVAGQWRGTSICTIRDSPCHDEQVVYLISKPGADGKHKIQMDKIVNGKQEPMGTLDCIYDRSDGIVTCLMDRGVWKFTLSGNKLDGTLTLSDGRLYRNISVTRE
jgi:hypothetical protein